jgi:ubiquinone/menaquinone biosynthesis C-methylase UbiE
MTFLQKIISGFMVLFFRHLYHTFAWGYDIVAAIVSLGKWQEWVFSIIPLIQGTTLLEIGHGSGHLLKQLNNVGFRPFGLDESRQMGRIASIRLAKTKVDNSNQTIVRGIAQSLPFPDEAFDSVVATFPGDFIFSKNSLAEIQRVLSLDGRLIVLLAAWATGNSIFENISTLLFKITGQIPKPGFDYSSLLIRFQDSGLKPEFKWIENPQVGRLLFIIAINKSTS